MVPKIILLLCICIIAIQCRTQNRQVEVTLQSDDVILDLSLQNELIVNVKIEKSGEKMNALPAYALPSLSKQMQVNLFDIRSVETGKKAIYTGMVAKRSNRHIPTLNLPAREERSTAFNLLSHYHFEEDGVYRVSIKRALPVRDGYLLLHSNYLEVNVTGATPYLRAQSHIQKRAVQYQSCSPSEQSIIESQLPKLQSSLANALEYLQEGCTENGYIEYFGEFDQSRYDTVTLHFQNMETLRASSNFGFDCSLTDCGSDTFAYVYPDDTTHTIYLCDLFWLAADNEFTFDSKAGVMIHEMSHFSDIAATDDYVYGEPYARDFAQTEPDSAILNADNYEYFSESEPVCGGVTPPPCLQKTFNKKGQKK